MSFSRWVDSHPRFQRANMHPKSLNIFIQCRLSKFFLINDFDLASDWKGFFGGIGSPDELFFSKLYVNIT